MKLCTDITPRRDGTVRVLGEDGQTYVFEGDPLECEIAHEPTLKRLLKLGPFFPAAEADEGAAMLLLQEDAADEQDQDGDRDLDPVDPNAPPVEEKTPPKQTKARKAT